MSSKTDDITGRNPQGRYDLPGGAYEIVETDVSGANAGASSNTAIGRRVITTYRPAYLSEDETVLACCHHAHELAKANGAREVMLEHLVHALVRVPDASQVLQDRGINVEGLKRESAAVISSEIPVDHTMMVAQLRASKDFNTVMHLAAAGASRRDERMLGVRDLLEALLRFDPKSRVVRMIRRYASEEELEDTVDPLTEVKATIERYAAESRDLRLAVNELRNAQAGQVTGAIAALEDRLRGLDRNLTLLVADQGGDRGQLADRTKAILDMLGSHRTDVRMIADRLQALERVGGVGDTGQLQSLISERFAAVHKALENQRNDVARLERIGGGDTGPLQTVIGERLQKALESQRAELARIDQSVADRIRALEERQASGAVPQLGAIAARLTAIEAKLADASKMPGTLPPGLDGLSDRLQGLERQIGASRAEMQAMQTSMQKDLKSIEELFDLIPAADGTQQAVVSDQRVAALQQTIDSHRADTQRLEAGLQQRHQSFERMLDAKLAGLGNLTGVGDRFARVEQALANQRTDQAGVRGTLDNELEQIRKAMLALGNAQQTLSSAIDEWRQNNSGDLSVVSNRLAALEKLAAAANSPIPLERQTPTTAAQQTASAPNGVPAVAPTSPTAPPAATVVQIVPSSGLLDRVERALANRGNGNGNGA